MGGPACGGNRSSASTDLERDDRGGTGDRYQASPLLVTQMEYARSGLVAFLLEDAEILYGSIACGERRAFRLTRHGEPLGAANDRGRKRHSRKIFSGPNRPAREPPTITKAPHRSLGLASKTHALALWSGTFEVDTDNRA
jgi:hypothetical protein